MATNKKLGNDFETDFCEILFENGFWVHNMAQNHSGQPADVIAVRNGKAYLIDCKVCSGCIFPFSRIEENQHNAMELWKACGNDDGWFALKVGASQILMFSHFIMKAFAHDKTILSYEDIMEYGVKLDEWVKKCK